MSQLSHVVREVKLYLNTTTVLEAFDRGTIADVTQAYARRRGSSLAIFDRRRAEAAAHPSDTLSHVVTIGVPLSIAPTVQNVLDLAYEIGNGIVRSSAALRYSNIYTVRGVRSLSVGDVVEVDGVRWYVDRSGFALLDG